MDEESRRIIRQIKAMEVSGMKVPLEKDALFARDTLCESLQGIVEQDDPDDQSPKGVAERLQKISFRKHVKINEPYLRELKGYPMEVRTDVELPCKYANCVTRAPVNDTMATFHEISSKNLECPICLSLFNQPKSLACSHTFCKDCLERIFQTQPDQQTLMCPVCRKGTPLPSGGVGKLQTNVPLSSLVGEVRSKNPTCTICEMDEKPPAVSYCQDCGKYMCESCGKGHSLWKPFSNHDVVPMTKVLSGKVPLMKRRQKCKKHPDNDEDCFCTVCREYICCKCGVLDHLQAGHQLEEAAVHEEKFLENIEVFRERVKSKKATIENHIEFIETQRNEITNMMRKLNDAIDKTYEECMHLLSDRREALKCKVKRLSEKFEKELCDMNEDNRRTIRHMNATEELVTNGMKVPLEKDALLAHDTLCENLEIILRRDDPDDQSPKGVTERAQKISFRKHVKVNELCLGELEVCALEVRAQVELQCANVSCMALAPDGKMAVGTFQGGTYFYSPDGELQQTVLKDVNVRGIGFLSDGRSVVRDIKNKISLYTSQWNKLDVTFQTRGFSVFQFCDLTVSRDDYIFVGYRMLRKIQVFAQEGGEAVREISCNRYSPVQLFSFHTTGSMILTDITHVVCLNSMGKKENVVMREDVLAFPAVCRDDSVIVAWVNHQEGLVSIDRYTRYLEYVHNLITDFKIQVRAMCNRYYLQEFGSDNIAFCSGKRLYIFDGV